MSDMKEVDYHEFMKTSYLGLCNPVKTKEALVLETLSEVFNHVDDVVVYCIRGIREQVVLSVYKSFIKG